MSEHYLKVTQNQNGRNKSLHLKLSSFSALPKFANFQHGEGLWQEMARFVTWTNTIGKYRITSWGTWKQGKNSISDSSDYRIGSANPDDACWAYSLVRQEMQFLEFGNEQGGGLAYAEKNAINRVAMTLSDVTGLGAGNDGRGMVSIGSAIFRAGFPVMWESINHEDYLLKP
jgi:hypothetical protein